MKFGAQPLSDAEGAVLAHAVKHSQGLFKKGRVLSSGDITLLQQSGIAEVVVAQLTSDEIPEDEAARALAVAAAGMGTIAQQAFTGRANVHSLGHGLVVVDRQRVNAINHLHESITIATLPAHSVVESRQMLATIKIIPFATPRQKLENALAIIGDQPLVHVCAFQRQHISLIISTLPSTKATLVEKTERAIATRLAALGLTLTETHVVPHQAAAISSAIAAAGHAGSDSILVFGAAAIVDRGDVIPQALLQAGGEVQHLGMPVDPGNLLMLGRLGDVPVLGVPSCARSPKTNGFDWVLERIMAGIAILPEDLMDMGVGGLLAEIPSRPSPREGQAPRSALVTAVVLAAGLGRRMGQNKMLADYGGVPLLLAALKNILAASVDEVVVVTGHEAKMVASAISDLNVRIVHNPDYATGMASSLRVGVEAAQHADAIVVCLGDMPSVAAATIDRMIAAFNPTEHRSIVVPTFQGQFGNPVLWGAEHFKRLTTLEGDKGARQLIAALKDEATEIAVADDGVLRDVDTPADLAGL
jgi:molybdenum cofactor cytidylyltransferase